jgi:hypothetical protein
MICTLWSGAINMAASKNKSDVFKFSIFDQVQYNGVMATQFSERVQQLRAKMAAGATPNTDRYISGDVRRHGNVAVWRELRRLNDASVVASKGYPHHRQLYFRDVKRHGNVAVWGGGCAG